MREQTFEKLYRLKLHGFAQALEEQIKNPEASSLSFEDRLAASDAHGFGVKIVP
jgi:hypothetical protein